MRATDRRLRGAAHAALFAALVLASPARADYREDYAEGLKAAKDGEWSEVEARMRDAIAESSAPQVQTRLYGQRFEPYVPAFFLGIALYKRGDCAQALQLLQNEATQAVTRDARAKRRLDEYLPVAQRGVADCGARLAGNGSTPSTAPSRPATPPGAPANTPSSPVSSNTPAAAPLATSPQTRPSTTPPASTPTKPPVQVASTTPATKPPAPATPGAAKAPALLAAALDDFLRGRYDRVAAADPATLADRRARYHALLLRAASRHTLALIQGGAAPLLAQAEADVRAAKALDPAAPDAQLYSPRFRQFYAETR